MKAYPAKCSVFGEQGHFGKCVAKPHSMKRRVRRYRLLRLKERIRKGDQFYHYISKIKWKRVGDNTIESINHFGGVPLHYKGRFRRPIVTPELPATCGAAVRLHRIVRWIRQHLCRRHGCHLNELRRTPDGGVECPCIRCGKMLHGSYGLMLECDWIKIPPNEKLTDSRRE